MSDKTREQSAIDIIYALKESIDKIEKKIDVIDGNLKLLNNKVVKLQKSINNIAVLPEGESTNTTSEVINVSDSETNVKKPDKYVTGPIRTFGKIMSKTKNPIPEVQITIFNDQSEVIKTRKTDSKGYWEVRLPPGKFGVQYTHKKFKSINIPIELESGMNEYEVK